MIQVKYEIEPEKLQELGAILGRFLALKMAYLEICQLIAR